MSLKPGKYTIEVDGYIPTQPATPVVINNFTVVATVLPTLR